MKPVRVPRPPRLKLVRDGYPAPEGSGKGKRYRYAGIVWSVNLGKVRPAVWPFGFAKGLPMAATRHTRHLAPLPKEYRAQLRADFEDGARAARLEAKGIEIPTKASRVRGLLSGIRGAR